MIRIGLVGEIGAGKTFVGSLFGYPVFNADKEIKKIYRKNKKCFLKLRKTFPKHIKTFPINKSEIKQILNKKNIKIISKITHPYVSLALKKFQKKNQRKKNIILDIPLLIENKLYKKSDILIYVKSKKKIIHKRLKKRGAYNKKILNILNAQQLDKNKKKKLCHFVVYNYFGKNSILRQVKQIKTKIND